MGGFDLVNKASIRDEVHSCLTTYQAAKELQAWPLALRSLHQARSHAIAEARWELESELNHLIVDAIVKREDRCR